jgi:hypothetical protein
MFSDMKGKPYLWIYYLLGLFTGFLYYDTSTLRGRPHFICTKGSGKWATEQQ